MMFPVKLVGNCPASHVWLQRGIYDDSSLDFEVPLDPKSRDIGFRRDMQFVRNQKLNGDIFHPFPNTPYDAVPLDIRRATNPSEYGDVPKWSPKSSSIWPNFSVETYGDLAIHHFKGNQSIY